jgi:hypothetical protein
MKVKEALDQIVNHCRQVPELEEAIETVDIFMDEEFDFLEIWDD